MKTPIVLKALMYTLLVISILGVGEWNPTHVLGDTSQEWAAVQNVVGADINPQAFLYPVMNAIGTQALQDGAILGIPADQFLSYQEHPARMMAAVQEMIQRYDSGAYGVVTVESLNQQADIFNTNGLSPVEQANLIERLRAQPLATSYLTPAKPTVTPPMYRPINPITAYFRLPDVLVGKLASSMRAGSGCSTPCAPLADYMSGPPSIFTYEVAPPLASKAFVNGIYWVGVYKTVDAARVENLRLRDLTTYGRSGYTSSDPLWLMDLAAKPLSIAAPVATNEWLRGYQSRVIPQNGLRDCYAIAGVRYNNILMLAQVDNYNSVTPPGYVTCQTSYKWSTRVLADLYTRAQNYARHH